MVGAVASGGLSVLTVVIATTSLGGGEAATGFLNAGIGLGGLVGAILAGALVLRPSLVPVLVGGSLVLAAGLAALGFAPTLGLAIAAIAVASAGGLLVEVTSTTIFQRVVPDAIRGRALGILGTVSTVAFAAGSFVLPVAGEAMGIGPVLAGTAIAVALAGIAGAFLAAPAARRKAGSAADVRVIRLASLPLFAGVGAPTLEAVATRLHTVRALAGEVIIRQGDLADRFYVVDAGSFEVTRGATRSAGAGAGGSDVRPAPDATRDHRAPAEHLRTLGPGDVFGEIGLLRGVPRTATVTAMTDGELSALDAPDFLELVNAGPLVGPRLVDLRRGAPGAGY